MWNKIVNWFSGILGSKLGAILNVVFAKAKTQAVAAIWDIALETVQTLSKTDLQNAEKREQAFKTIKKYAKSKGQEVADSVINLTIEMAVAAMKG